MDVIQGEITEYTSKTINETQEIQHNQNEANQVIQDMYENNKNSSNPSDYESIDSGASSSEDEIAKVQENRTDKDLYRQESVSDNSVILEREEGDGQESVPVKKVDDDEDKKNPQYIPKRGTFYEHDDRTLDDSNDKDETQEKTEKQSKKSIWMEKKEHWSHDRYNDNEQAPKSRAELVAIYGYDIRNEDGPPRARRRRRYGRGPNKYTRTWEDEEAYKPTKPIKSVVKKNKSKDDEDYPPLNPVEKQTENVKEDSGSNKEEEEEEVLRTQKKFSPAIPDGNLVTNSSANKQEMFVKKSNNSLADQTNLRSQQPRVGTGRIVKPKLEINKEIKDSDYKGFTKSRQFRNSLSEQKILPKNQKKNDVSGNYNNKYSNVEDVEKDLNKLNIQEGTSKNNNKLNSQRQTSVPPRLQAEQKGSKRYSSLRQRSLPETAAPPFPQPTNYYTNDYSQQPQAPPQSTLLPQPNQIHATNPVPQIAPPPLPLPQQVTVTPTSILQAPPQFAAPFPQAPPPFLQPTVPPPPFLPQQPPSIINYVQGQPQFPPTPPYQGYQHQQFNTVNQPSELYQYQGGTTYYSTQNQHVGQRAVPQKRRTAAIPIVPPPPLEPQNYGRNNQTDFSPIEDDMGEDIDNNNDYGESAFIVQH